jgi:hypothetical protein
VSRPAALALVALAMLACRSLVPIYEVNDAPLLVEGDVTLDDVADAIWRAGGQLGWEIQRESPGVLRGTLRLRSHLAVVRIEHDTRSFSIHGVETRGIRREGDLIHPNYNGWIQNLRTRIIYQKVTPRKRAPASGQ